MHMSMTINVTFDGKCYTNVPKPRVIPYMTLVFVGLAVASFPMFFIVEKQYPLILLMISLGMIAFTKYLYISTITSSTPAECTEGKVFCVDEKKRLDSIPVEPWPCERTPNTLRCVAQKMYDECMSKVLKFEDYGGVASVIFDVNI